MLKKHLKKITTQVNNLIDREGSYIANKTLIENLNTLRGQLDAFEGEVESYVHGMVDKGE